MNLQTSHTAQWECGSGQDLEVGGEEGTWLTASCGVRHLGPPWAGTRLVWGPGQLSYSLNLS